MTQQEKYELHQQFTEYLESDEGQNVLIEAVKKYIDKNFTHIRDVRFGDSYDISKDFYEHRRGKMY